MERKTWMPETTGVSIGVDTELVAAQVLPRLFLQREQQVAVHVDQGVNLFAIFLTQYVHSITK
jgi:hypothetical protein